MILQITNPSAPAWAIKVVYDNFHKFSATFAAHYLRRVPELVRHDVVEEWVDARGQEVSDAGDVGEGDVDTHEEAIAAEGLVHDLAVHGHNALSVERRPAEEEADDDGNCNENGSNRFA